MEIVLIATTKSNPINYDNDLVVDSGGSHHMMGDVEKLLEMEEYKGTQFVVTSNNSKLPTIHVGDLVIVLSFSRNQV